MPSKSKLRKGATIQFVCEPEWKRQIMAGCAMRGWTIKDVCVDLLSKHFKVSANGKEKAA